MRRFQKRLTAVIMLLTLLLSMGGCAKTTGTKKYSSSFFDCFDTVTTVYGYAENQEKFNEFVALVHEKFLYYHQQFDGYTEYDGINNVYTINKYAGVEPVTVSDELFALIQKSKELYAQTGGKVNIAMGAVLQVWENYRQWATKEPDNAKLPSTKELGMAAMYMDINRIELDAANSSVYLSDSLMSIHVGAVAKGYACELVKNDLVKNGYNQFVISAGGNVVAVGQDSENENGWNVGIQNPDTHTTNDIVDTVEVKDKAVVTAGSYQRYFTVDGKRYHHIIDPATLMPTIYYDSVTVICDDSMVADFMATTLFILPPALAMRMAEDMPQLEAIWIDTDGAVTYTSGYGDYSKSY